MDSETTTPSAPLHAVVNWHRCKWEDRDDGLWFCEGHHERSSDCEWVKFTEGHAKSMIHYEQMRLLRAFTNVHSSDGDILGAYAHQACALLPPYADEIQEHEDDKLLESFLAMKRAMSS